VTAKVLAKIIWLSISAIRLVPHSILLKAHPEREIMLLDMERWVSQYQKCFYMCGTPGGSFNRICSFVQLMTSYPEFRTLFYYRAGWTSKLLQPLCQPMPLLSISNVDEGIGPGFMIMHGRASGVAARRIGKNCCIFQHVSIGYISEGAKPVLGDNVTVFAGAKILGNVTIGNNCLVGANAVVLKNVPDNCTVVGVPASIVRRNGVKVREALQ